MRYETKVAPRQQVAWNAPEARPPPLQKATKASPPSPPLPFGNYVRKGAVGIFDFYFSSRGEFSFFPGGIEGPAPLGNLVTISGLADGQMVRHEHALRLRLPVVVVMRGSH